MKEEEWLSDKKLRELSSKDPHLKHLSKRQSEYKKRAIQTWKYNGKKQ